MWLKENMTRTENTIHLLRRFAKRHRIAPSRLAHMAGLHENTLLRMHEDSWNPTAKTLRALEALVEKEYGREEAA